MIQSGGKGPFAPHPQYVFQYRFPQFGVTPQVQQNLLRATAKGCGEQGTYEDCGGAPTYPLAQFNPVTQLGRLAGLIGLGDDAASGPTSVSQLLQTPSSLGPVSDVTKALSWQEKVAAAAWGSASVIGTGLGAYHGFKRNNSVGWALWWALMGGLFPVITVPVAIAQGFGKRKGR
jgi:hypothetical protein